MCVVEVAGVAITNTGRLRDRGFEVSQSVTILYSIRSFTKKSRYFSPTWKNSLSLDSSNLVDTKNLFVRERERERERFKIKKMSSLLLRRGVRMVSKSTHFASGRVMMSGEAAVRKTKKRK